MLKIKIYSVNEITKAAKLFLTYLKTKTNAKCLAFYGMMGVGKTTFIQALCKELAVIDVVTSPSFAIINEYKTKESTSIFHFDFYRINKIDEVYDLGYEDYFYSDSYCFIEWPEKIELLLPENFLAVKINELENGQRELIIL